MTDTLRDQKRAILRRLVDEYIQTPRTDKDEDLSRLDACLDDLEAVDQTRIKALEEENASLKTPLVAVRFVRNENPYGEVYYTAAIGSRWKMELNRIPSQYEPFYFSNGKDSTSISSQDMDDLITLLLASRIYSARINGLRDTDVP